MRSLPISSAGAALLLGTPVAALAADAANVGYSLMGSLLQMVAALSVVVGLILLFSHVAKRWLNTTTIAPGGNRYIRIVETRFLAPKKSLMLVEVGGEYLLLANAGDQLQLIKQVDMLEEIEVLEVAGDVPGSAFRERLQEFLRSLPKSGARPDPAGLRQEVRR